MPDQEQITLEIDDTPGQAAVARMNASMAKYEQGAKIATAGANRSFEDHGEKVIRISDRSRSSTERLVASAEKLAKTYGTTGIEKLIGQRDQLIQRLGNEEKAVERVRVAYGKMIEAEGRRGGEGGGGLAHLGESLKEFVEHPLAGAQRALGGVLERLGPVGVGIAAIATGAVAAGVAFYEMAKGVGESAERIVNLSTSTGLTIKQVDELSAMAKIVGIDLSSITSIGGRLSATLDQGGAKAELLAKHLDQIGVSTRDVSGALKEPGPLIEDVLKGLSRIPDTGERVTRAFEILPRRLAAGLLPVIENFNQLQSTVRDLGFGLDEHGIKKADEFEQQVHALELRWEHAKRSLAVPVEAVFKFVFGPIGRESGEREGEGGRRPQRGSLFERDEQTGRWTFDWNRRFGDQSGGKPPAQFAPGPDPEAAKRDREKAVSDDFERQRAAIELRYSTPLQRLQTQLKAAREEQPDIIAKGDIGRYDANSRRIHQLEEAIKNNPKIEANQEESRKIIEKLTDRVAAPYGLSRTQAVLAGFRERREVTPAQISHLENAPEVTASMRRDYDLAVSKLQAKGRESIEKAAALTTRQPQPRTAEEYSRQEIAAKAGAEREFLGSLERETKEREKQQSVIEKTLGFDRQRRATEEEAAASIRAIASLDISSGAQIRNAAEIAGIKLKYVNEQYAFEQSKVDAIAKYIEDADDRRAELRIKHEEDLSKLQIELAEKSATVYREQIESIVKPAEGLFHTLFTDPRKFGSELGQTLKNAFLKPVEEGLANLTAKAIHPFVFGQDGQGGIAGGIHSLFDRGEQNPAKIATDLNTTAMGQLRTAIAGLTLVVSAAGGVPGHVEPIPSPAPQQLTQTVPLQTLLSQIPHFAEGGIVNQPTIGLFGEAGPEAIVPLGKGGWLQELQKLIGWKHQPEGTGARDQVPAMATPVPWQNDQNSNVAPWQDKVNSIAQSPAGTLGETALGLFAAHKINEPQWHEAVRLVKQVYHLKTTHQEGQHIADIANEKYGHRVSIAVRSPEVRESLGFHAPVAQALGMPAYETGGIVPDNGPAWLHKGEAVIPAELTELLGNVARGGGAKDQPQLLGSLDALTLVMRQNAAMSYGLSRVMGAGLGIPAFAAPAGLSGVSIPNVSGPSSDTAPLNIISRIAASPRLTSWNSYDPVATVPSALPGSLDLPSNSGPVPGGDMGRTLGPAGPGGFAQARPFLGMALRFLRPGGSGFSIPGLNTNAGGFEQGPGTRFGGFSGAGFKQFLGIGTAQNTSVNVPFFGGGGAAQTGADTVSVPSFGDTAGTAATTAGTSFSSVAGSQAAGMGGMFLAQEGLMPGSRFAGTAAGIAMGTAGGAAVGFSYGGPIGAAVGAGVGFGIGLGELVAGVEPQWKEAERLAKQIYHISIPQQTGQQIAAIANQSYGGRVSIAIRAPEVRQMLGLFAAGTNQKFPASADQPHAFDLVQQGGVVQQAPSYQYGNAYSYQSNFPTAGGYSSQQLPNPHYSSSTPVMGTPSVVASNAGPQSITHVMQLDGPATTALLRGEISNVVTPDYTQDQYSDAMAGSNGRLSASALVQQPGLIIS